MFKTLTPSKVVRKLTNFEPSQGISSPAGWQTPTLAGRQAGELSITFRVPLPGL
jgi:hypothetical protein